MKGELSHEHCTQSQGFRAPWQYDVAPFHIVDNLYYVGNTSVSVHLFDTGEGLLLDTAYGETAYLLLESIREMGFDPHDIRWILHSHAHIDHYGATRYLAEKYGCKTYMPTADFFMLEDADWSWCTPFNMKYEPPYDYYFKPDVGVNPGDVLKFGNITVTAYSAAGHTPGTMAYIFDLPGGLKVDVVLGNHPGQSHTFEKLAARTPENNTFIDPTEWDRFLDETREWARKLLENDPI